MSEIQKVLNLIKPDWEFSPNFPVFLVTPPLSAYYYYSSLKSNLKKILEKGPILPLKWPPKGSLGGLLTFPYIIGIAAFYAL